MEIRIQIITLVGEEITIGIIKTMIMMTIITAIVILSVLFRTLVAAAGQDLLTPFKVVPQVGERGERREERKKRMSRQDKTRLSLFISHYLILTNTPSSLSVSHYNIHFSIHWQEFWRYQTSSITW